jgi:short-subunit dehydrogenase
VSLHHSLLQISEQMKWHHFLDCLRGAIIIKWLFMTIKQQYALVTGGTEGMGYELAKLLAGDGYNLVLVATQERRLCQAAEELNSRYQVEVLPMASDLFDKNAPYRLYNSLKAKGLQMDVVINDAGKEQYQALAATDLISESDIIRLNITSFVVLTNLFLKDMVERKEGKIMNIASMEERVTGPLQPVFQGTRAFMQTYTGSISHEVKDSGVTVASLLPDLSPGNGSGYTNMQEPADLAGLARTGYDVLMKGEEIPAPAILRNMHLIA